MIIGISGSVGAGKTTIADMLSRKLGFEVMHLNEKAAEHKISDNEHQGFDFDLGKLLSDLEPKLEEMSKTGKNLIVEGHFAHFISCMHLNVLFVINRHQKELVAEYEERGYSETKMEDNLEVENFNNCFYEAIENGYEEDRTVFTIENKDLNQTIAEIESILIKLKNGESIERTPNETEGNVPKARDDNDGYV